MASRRQSRAHAAWLKPQYSLVDLLSQTRVLKTNSQYRSKHIQVSRSSDAIVLTHEVKILCNMTVEAFTYTGSKAVSSPTMKIKVIEDFI